MQGDGPFTDGINVTIRRNYIYEDAYDKLSPENGTEAHIKHVKYWLFYTPLGSTVLAVLLSTVIYLFISSFIGIYLVSG